MPKRPVAPYRAAGSVGGALPVDRVTLSAEVQQQLARESGERVRDAETPAERVMLAGLREALRMADTAGVKRSVIAAKLGVEVGTLESWILPGRMARVPGVRVVEFLLRADVLPAEARVTLWRRLADAAGMAISAKPCGQVANPGEVTDEILGSMHAIGDLAEAASSFASAESDGGVRVTPLEKAKLLERLSRLEMESADVRAAIEALPNVASPSMKPRSGGLDLKA